MLPQDDDDAQQFARWLYHLATWLEGAEQPSASSCALHPRLERSLIDHSIGAKVLVAVQGPWWLSARADRNTLTDAGTHAYLDYTHTVILVTDGSARSCEAAEGRERVFLSLIHI